MSEIARRLMLNKATAHSFLTTMTSVGLLERHLDFTYSLGLEMVAMGHAALARHRTISFARQEASLVAAETGLSCVVSIVSGDHIVGVGESGSITSPISATPLVPPFGSVFLAWAKEQEIDEWIGRAGHISSEARLNLLQGLEGVRNLGFHMTRPIDRVGMFIELARIDGSTDYVALARSVRKIVGDLGNGPLYTVTHLDSGGTVLPDLLAVPAFGPDGSVVVALTVTGFVSPMNSDDIRNLVTRVRKGCDRITSVSGGRRRD